MRARLKRILRAAVPDRLRRTIGRWRGLLSLSEWYANSQNGRHLGDLRAFYLGDIRDRRNLTTALKARYRTVAPSPTPQVRSRFLAEEAKIYSQCGEDGLILFLLSKIGTQSCFAAEIGAGGYSSNIVNLIVNFAWSGVLIDGNLEDLESLRSRVLSNQISQFEHDRLDLLHQWVTRDNVDDMLSAAAPPDGIDVLSIDIDGNDLWVWDRITSVRPRLVILEYNALFGDSACISTPYDPAFNRARFHRSAKIFGASLGALTKVSARKGYRLVCCDSWGVNAFFVRDDLAEGHFEALAPPEAFYDHFQWQAVYGDLRSQLPAAGLVEVE